MNYWDKDLLRYLAGSPVGKRFFLTGGTALAARYLQHLTESRKKHVGMDDYWLAVSFQQVEGIAKWAKLMVSCGLDDLRKFFHDRASWLMKGLQS